MTGSATTSGNSRLAVLLIAATTLSSSGCLTALGLNRSSLSPRVATSELALESTVRSQDNRLSGQWNDSPQGNGPESARPAFGWSGLTDARAADSAPAANIVSSTTPPKATSGYADYGQPPAQRQVTLLPPQFGTSSVSKPTDVTSGPVIQPAADSQIVIQPGPPNAQPALAAFQQHSNPPSSTPSAMAAGDSDPANAAGFGNLGFTANQVRSFLNQQSRNAMSEGQVLKDRVSQWQMFPPARAAAATDPLTDPDPPATDSVLKSEEKTVSLSDQGETPQTPAAAVSSTLEAEPSMLDRLKGIYEPGVDANARRLWKRPFPKIQNPWSVFRERQEAAVEPPEPPPSMQTAELPEPLDSEQSVINPLLVQLIAATETELQNWPRQLNGSLDDLTHYRRRQQDLRLLYLLADQPGGAIQVVEDLPEGEQEFWQELMLALAQYRADDPDLTTEQRLTNTAGQIKSAVKHLAPLTSLRIRRFEICSRIHSFGRIEAFPSNDFDPGQPILLYAEVENFATEMTAGGTQRTRFDAQLQILEEGNDKPKDTIDLSNVTDEATSERTDYYQSFELNLPSHFKPGQYRIRLRLRDRITGKLTESNASFQVR